MNEVCCSAMEMVHERENIRDKSGITTAYSMTGSTLVHAVRKGVKAKEPETWSATYVVMNYCPFCGVKLK